MAFERLIAAFRIAEWRADPALPPAAPARQATPQGQAQRPSLPQATLTCPMTGPERAAVFAELRRKAATRAAELR